MKTVAALANAEGGTLLFGIDNDGAVVGLGIDDTRKLLDRMTQLARDGLHIDVLDGDVELALRQLRPAAQRALREYRLRLRHRTKAEQLRSERDRKARKAALRRPLN